MHLARFNRYPRGFVRAFEFIVLDASKAAVEDGYGGAVSSCDLVGDYLDGVVHVADRLPAVDVDPVAVDVQLRVCDTSRGVTHAQAVVTDGGRTVNFDESVLGPEHWSARVPSTAADIGADEVRRLEYQRRNRSARTVDLHRRAPHIALVVGSDRVLAADEPGLSEVRGQQAGGVDISELDLGQCGAGTIDDHCAVAPFID